MHYASIEDAVHLVKASGVGSFMAKTDIKKAYRIIPIEPQQYHLFCFERKNSFYFDKCLQMGCSSSSQIFEKFSSAVDLVAKHHLKIPHICHILDDFFLVDPNQSGYQNKLDIFSQTCAPINIPMAPDKTTATNTTMCFMGYEIDSVKSEIHLPSDKLEKCNSWEGISLSYYWFNLGGVKTISQHQGHQGGKERFAYLASLPAFLQRYNSLPRGNVPGTNIKALDHRSRKGFGLFLDNHWFYREWPAWWKHQNIVLLELVPIVLAVETWGCGFQNAAVTCHMDNKALVAIINKQSSKLRVVMTMIRRLVQASLKYNFLFKAVLCRA